MRFFFAIFGLVFALLGGILNALVMKPPRHY